MKIISFREKAMLLCMLVLIFFLISIFVRLGAKHILIKRLHWDNAITHTITIQITICIPGLVALLPKYTARIP